jgi:hypothetical protein
VDANEKQVGGEHYKNLDPQPWDVIAAWKLDFFEGNVLKYLVRRRRQSRYDDLQKAMHYLEKLIEAEVRRRPSLSSQYSPPQPLSENPYVPRDRL